jgi:hypothetical protein
LGPLIFLSRAFTRALSVGDTLSSSSLTA